MFHWTSATIESALHMPVHRCVCLCLCTSHGNSQAMYHNASANREKPIISYVHLLPATETKDQMEGRLLLDVVVAQSTAVLQLLTSKDQSLLVRWDSLLVLD